LWGKRKEDKYPYLLNNDVRTTKNWKELKPVAPYYFFVPKDFALQEEYDKFWKVTDIFKMWSSGVKTSRDKLVIGFTKEEILQRMVIFKSSLTDDFIIKTLKINDTRDWSLSESRKKCKREKLEDRIVPYSYRVFDNRLICYSFNLIEPGCNRIEIMKHLINENIALSTTRLLSSQMFCHVFVTKNISDICYNSNKTKEVNYFFTLYLYPDEPVRAIHELPLQKDLEEKERTTNFKPEFLKTIYETLGKEPTPEEVFFYIYAVLFSTTYRKRYEEFLKIDFPRIPLPSNLEYFQEMSNLGKELADLHLLKHPLLSETEIGFPKGGSKKVEKIKYDEGNKRVYINKEQYFENIDSKVWIYKIGAYQVMEKYLKDRKKRKLSLDDINHYMKVAKAIKLTIQIQGKIDEIFCK